MEYPMSHFFFFSLVLYTHEHNEALSMLKACDIIPQSIPAVPIPPPPPPGANPQELEFFKKNGQFPRGGDNAHYPWVVIKL